MPVSGITSRRISDITTCSPLMYRFKWGKTLWKATLEVNNVFSQDYDVILNYPMPKRNYGISLDVTI